MPLFFLEGVKSAQWSNTSLPEGQILYACAGDTVTLTWKYALTSEEVLGDTEWVYDGQSQELVAISSHGHFFPTPTFSQRVSRVDNAGLSLSKVTVPDSGNYSVEVSLSTQGGTSRIVLRRTAVLYVSDGLMTTDGVLHITHLRDPIYDPVSKQWILQLQCGHFVYKDNPPYDVEWTTPSGEIHNSTSFSNGNFYLSIPMPIESGTYTCRIPGHLSARACLHGNDTNEGRATVTVESAEARLLLLEKENSDLKATLAEQASRHNQTVEDLKATVVEQVSRLTQELQRLNSQLQQTQNQLSNTTTDLTDRVQSATWSASSLQDEQQLYACAGDNVTLTWNYTMNAGEELIDVQWLYNGHSQELVAMYSQGTFLPTLSFSQRVTSMDNAGLTLSNVLVADSGNYSVRVNVYSPVGALHPMLAVRSCLHGNSQSGVAVRVESVEARLMLLEKENLDLKQKLAANTADLATALTSQNQTVADLSGRLTSLQQSHTQLSTTTINLQARL